MSTELMGDRFLILADHLICSARQPAMEAAALLVQDGVIREVDLQSRLQERYPDVERWGPYPVVMPGLINAHTHFSEGLIPGLGERLSIWEWGNALLVPTGRHLTREMAYFGTMLKGIELLQSGVTAVNDMYCHGNYGHGVSLGVVDALEALGLRGRVCLGAEDTHWTEPMAIEAILDEHLQLAERAKAAPMIGFCMGIGTVLGQTDGLLQRSIEMARQHGWPIHTHLAEVREEKVMARLRWGKSTVEHAAACGLLDGPCIAGHGIWLDREERALLAEHGTTIVHNPQANMILGSGICRLGELEAAGIQTALGTDGAASNDSHNMLEVLKLTGLLQKVAALDPAAIAAPAILQMATANAAMALGWAGLTGEIAIGMQADVVAFSSQSPGTAVVHDPFQQVVYGTSPRDVCDVWVAGRLRLHNGQPPDLDTGHIYSRSRELAALLSMQSKLKDIRCLQSPF